MNVEDILRLNVGDSIKILDRVLASNNFIYYGRDCRTLLGRYSHKQIKFLAEHAVNYYVNVSDFILVITEICDIQRDSNEPSNDECRDECIKCVDDKGIEYVIFWYDIEYIERI